MPDEPYTDGKPERDTCVRVLYKRKSVDTIKEHVTYFTLNNSRTGLRDGSILDRKLY